MHSYMCKNLNSKFEFLVFKQIDSRFTFIHILHVITKKIKQIKKKFFYNSKSTINLISLFFFI